VLNQASILCKVESLPDFILPFWFFYVFTHETKVVTFLREVFVDVRIHVLQMDNFPYGEALDASQSLVSHRLSDDTPLRSTSPPASVRFPFFASFGIVAPEIYSSVVYKRM